MAVNSAGTPNMMNVEHNDVSSSKPPWLLSIFPCSRLHNSTQIGVARGANNSALIRLCRFNWGNLFLQDTPSVSEDHWAVVPATLKAFQSVSHSNHRCKSPEKDTSFLAPYPMKHYRLEWP